MGGCLPEEQIRQRYSWPQATPHSQFESRIHIGWRACSQSPSGRDSIYLQPGGFPSRGEYCLCCRVQGCDTGSFTWALVLQRLCNWIKPLPRVLQRDFAELVSLTGSWHKSTKGWWAHQWLLVSLLWGTNFHFFRLEKWNQCSLILSLTHSLRNSC